MAEETNKSGSVADVAAELRAKVILLEAELGIASDLSAEDEAVVRGQIAEVRRLLADLEKLG